MLRMIGLFLLLIISRLSLADVINATVTATASTVNVYTLTSPYLSLPACASSCSAADALSFAKAVSSSRPDLGAPLDSFSLPSVWGEYAWIESKTGKQLVKVQFFGSTEPSYSCPSGYFLSDSAGNFDSSGRSCTKESCTTKTDTYQMVEILSGETAPVTGCYRGCSGTNMQYLYDGKAWTCSSGAGLTCSYNMRYDGNSCSVASNSDSTASGSGGGCGAAGTTTGTVNGQSVSVCKGTPTSGTGTGSGDGSTSPPTSGAGSTVGSPENTSGTQNSTVGGGTGSLSGSGYGGGSSTGSGGTSGGGSSTGSGGTSGGGSSTGSGGTSGGGGSTGSGGTSGSGTGSGTGDGSGSGTGSGTGDGSGSGAASGASPTIQTSAADSTCPEGSDSVACATMDSPTADDLPSTEAAWGFTQQSAFGGLDTASCPAALTVMPGVEFSFENLCSFFQRMRPFVLGIAWLIAAYIATGSRNTSVGDD